MTFPAHYLPISSTAPAPTTRSLCGVSILPARVWNDRLDMELFEHGLCDECASIARMTDRVVEASR